MKWPFVSRVKALEEQARMSESWREFIQAMKEHRPPQIVRGAAVSDQELKGLLNIPPEHPVLRGVLEVLARAEERSVEDYAMNEGKSRDDRADGAIAVRAIRNVRADVLAAVEMARRKT